MPKVFDVVVYNGNRAARSFKGVGNMRTDEDGTLWLPAADESGFAIFAKGFWSEVQATTVK